MIAWERGKGVSASGCLALHLEEVESAVVRAFVEFIYKGTVLIAPYIEQVFALVRSFRGPISMH